MTDDFYHSVQYPNVDHVNGGSLNGMKNWRFILKNTPKSVSKLESGVQRITSLAEVRRTHVQPVSLHTR
jgi:hypothetical protein